MEKPLEAACQIKLGPQDYRISTLQVNVRTGRGMLQEYGEERRGEALVSFLFCSCSFHALFTERARKGFEKLKRLSPNYHAFPAIH